jgi:hypothetical protein
MSGLPPRRDVNANDTEFEGLEQTPDGPAHNVDYWQFITRDYLETMRIPLRRWPRLHVCRRSGAPTLLINERLARVFYPDGTRSAGASVRPAPMVRRGSRSSASCGT